ncbi:mce related protein [Gordonia rubripertincta]|nr:mce related protein [Gordonia rubripertincta]
MPSSERSHYSEPPYKTAGAILLIILIALVAVSLVSFRGGFTEAIPVVVESDRSGLVMDVGSKVKYHGLQIGTVKKVSLHDDRAVLEVGIDPAKIGRVPDNVTAIIEPTTVFGAKYVEFAAPSTASTRQLAAGARIQSTNVTNEINTVFENLTSLLEKVDPAKVNGLLGGLAQGLQGRGEQFGQTLTDADRVLTAVNPTLPQLQEDLRLTNTVSNNLAGVTDEIMGILKNASVTSQTVSDRRDDVQALLLSAVGLGDSGQRLFGDNRDGIVNTLRLLTPTTALLKKYSPQFTCMFHVGAVSYEHELPVVDTTGYSASLDAGLLWGDDPYTNPDNLPVVATKNGPHGKPGCYPLINWNTYPAPYLRMNNGAPLNGAGTDKPRLASPTLIEYLTGKALGGKGRP